MKSKTKTLVSVISIVIIIIAMHYLSWLIPLENFFRDLIAPGSKLMYSLSVDIGEETKEFSSVEELKNAYKKTREELLKNKVEKIELDLTKEENNELRKQLNFSQPAEYKTIGAEVIGKNIDPLGNNLIINKGSSNNIEKGNPVIVGDGIFIGKIMKVEPDFSIIRLINDNQSKIASTLISAEKSIGLVEGGYGISVYMNFIPQNESVNVGDIVVTSGLEKKIPRGLLIGEVQAVEKEAYQPFQKAIISPMVNLEKIRLTSVIIST